MGQNFLAAVPTAAYGGVLLTPAIAFYMLQRAIIRGQGEKSVLAEALGADLKGRISPVLYVAGTALAFVDPWLSMAAYLLVAILWLIPDQRIANVIGRE